MPVMHFRIQWPDGGEANCYSPSRVVSEFFTPGHAYPLEDFVQRSREALGLAFDLRELIQRRRTREPVLLPHALRGDA